MSAADETGRSAEHAWRVRLILKANLRVARHGAAGRMIVLARRELNEPTRMRHPSLGSQRDPRPRGLATVSQGLSRGTPVAWKSATLRVTTVMWWTIAVAAINASRSDLGSGTCNEAQRCATAVSTGSTLPENAGRTC